MKFLIQFICLFSISFLGFAEDRIDLLMAYKNAIVFDANFQAANKNNLAYSELTNQARAAFLPQISIRAFEGRGNTDRTNANFPQGNTIAYDSKNYSLTVRQSIFDKSNFDSYKKAQLTIDSSTFQVSIEKLHLASRVVSEYLDVLLYQDYLHYADLQKISIQGQLDLAKNRFDQGYGTLTEISQAEAALQELISNEAVWKNSLEVAMRALEKTTGMYSKHFNVLDINQFSKKFSIMSQSKLEEWISLANQSSPIIKKAEKDLEVAETDISRSYAAKYPTLDLIASQTLSENDNNQTIGSRFNTTMGGFQLNIPIFDGGLISSKTDQVIALKEELYERLKEARRNVELNVRRYFNEVNSGIARIDSVKAARDSYKVTLTGTKKGYLAGMNSNIEVLNAQAKFYMAQRDFIKQHYLLIHDTVLLREWAGVLNEEDIMLLNADFKADTPYTFN